MNSTLQNPVFTSEQPISLNGQCGYRIDNDRVLINIDGISNNRFDGDLSGTLAVELWALAHPYQGQEFSGFATAATSIGEIQGQFCLRNCLYELNFQQPPAGTWNLVLMVREWENGAYITRDYVNFATLYEVAGAPADDKPAVTRSEKDNVIAVAFRETTARQEEPKAEAAKVETGKTETPEPVKAEVGKVETPKPAKAEAARIEVAQPVKVEAGKIETPKPAAVGKTRAANERVSINKAVLAEIEAIKGISKKLARSIVDSRPYKTLEDLLKVKGMGKKLLKQLEDKISL